MPMIRRVIRYSGHNFNEVMQLPCDVFLLMNKNAILDDLNQSESGREYLRKCERLAVTQPDLPALRERMKKGR